MSMAAHQAQSALNDVRDALALGVARLESASVPSAALAAELLLLHVLGRDRTWLYAHPEQSIRSEECARYEELLRQRSEGVPVQYLTGKQEFWGLEFEVTPSVLIPRPETEHLVEVVLQRMGERRRHPLMIADVGTGSGCIAVALAREFPNARIVATDISAAALQVAQRNVERHNLSDRIDLREMDLLRGYLAAGGTARTHFDVIASNPPYIGRNEAADLQREVLEHEPHQALFAGDEGLEVYPQLIEQAAKLLGPGGLLVIELGYGLANRVRAILASSDWAEVTFIDDLAGIPRVLAAKRI